jgi:N-acylglucosamine-6-phosphate 2-epimerase
MKQNFIFDGGIIVSCQADVDSPLRDPYVMALMAAASEKAGAVGIRAEGAKDINAIMKACSLPIIGIRKKRHVDSDVFITATRNDIDILVGQGVKIIALDATTRYRPGGETLGDLIAYAKGLNLLVMADLASVQDASKALMLGADYLATTLIDKSYQDIRPGGPNVVAVRKIIELNPGATVIAEGRYSTPEDIVEAFKAGAKSVVVGRAITDTEALARDLIEATPGAQIPIESNR